MTDLEQCLAEQKRAADYILEHGYDRGAALGLSDWTAEEILFRTEVKNNLAAEANEAHQPDPQ